MIPSKHSAMHLLSISYRNWEMLVSDVRFLCTSDTVNVRHHAKYLFKSTVCALSHSLSLILIVHEVSAGFQYRFESAMRSYHGVGRTRCRTTTELTVKLNRLQLKKNMVSQSIWLQEFIISTHFYQVCNVFTHVDVYLTHFSAKCTSDTRVVYLTFLRHQESLASDFYCS